VIFPRRIFFSPIDSPRAAMCACDAFTALEQFEREHH